MELDIIEIARMCGGQLGKITPATISGYSIDSRTTQPGDLFIPLIAERDGHDYISDAIQAGAVAHLYSQGKYEKNAIYVENTLEALQRLGRVAFEEASAVSIGVTGSVGKTTTKDMLKACFAQHHFSWASERSFNNEIGVPLSILSSPANTEFLILEMGARGIGHIRKLCEISKPSVGVVTSIGIAHSEFFGDLSQIILAKGEIVESLDTDGLAVLNNDDPNVRKLQNRTSADVLLCGTQGGDVVAENIRINSELKPNFVLSSPWGSSPVCLNVSGEHNIANALAAAGTAMYFDVPISKVVNALESVEISPFRMETYETSRGMLVINDSYNANPLSMTAALKTLISSRRKNLIAILGVMAELGDEHTRSHIEIGDFAKSNNVEIISINIKEYGGQLASSIEEALQILDEKSNMGEDTAILIKGSRVVGLEALAKKITK